MSTSLELLPVFQLAGLSQNVAHCTTVLEFDQNYGIYSQLGNLAHLRTDDRPDILKKPTIPTTKLPRDFRLTVRNEEAQSTDDFGRLTYVLAKDLLKVVLPEKYTEKSEAVLAYVKCLPGITPIILRWST